MERAAASPDPRRRQGWFLGLAGGLATSASLPLEWFRVPLFIEGDRAFRGYEVAVLGAVLAVSAAFVLVGTGVRRPRLVAGSGAAIVAMAAAFLAIPGPMVRESWRWASGGTECLERCLAPERGVGGLVALAGGLLALSGGILLWRWKARQATAAARPPSAPA